MTAQWLVLVAAILLGSLSSYTTTLASRGAEGAEAVLRQRGARSILGGLGIIAVFASIIWGFVYLTWYWVLLLVVGILFLNGFIYGGRAGFVFWYSVQPALDLLCIAGAAWLWFFA